MKMVKSLLLGTAAGLVAMTGAQAADLPVKAKPVQYVKICSLYGAGFYYIPGTDMCLKMGGWVRAEIAYGDGLGSMTAGSLSADTNNRYSSNLTWRSRGYITADARNQTEYGTVRGYIAVGTSYDTTGGPSAVTSGGSNAATLTGATGLSVNRLFIQWAGFTIGTATSFYDFYNAPAVGYFAAYPNSDRGDGGVKVVGYTAQFGNGVSATLAIEEPQRTLVWNTGTGAAAGYLALNAGAAVGGVVGNGGQDTPDITGNLRVDQAWGSAQIMGALHQVNSGYYGANAVLTGPLTTHPSDVWGYAVGAGLRLNAPAIGPGDYFQAQVQATSGASRYSFGALGAPTFFRAEGGTIGYGLMSDATYGTLAQGGLELTKTTMVSASYEHFWNKAWRTSVYGGWAKVDYSTNANTWICANQNNFVFGGGNTAVCDNDYSVLGIGTRTQWNVTPDFYLGLDVLYQKLYTASAGTALVGASTMAGYNVGSPVTISDVDAWALRLRAHKDFYP